MKYWPVLSLLVGAVLASPTFASPLFVSLDIYSEGGIGDGYKKDAQTYIDALATMGAEASGNVTADSGLGARIGGRVAKDFGRGAIGDFGVSMGIIRAPSVTTKNRHSSFGGINGPAASGTTIDSSISFVRALVEAGHQSVLGKSARFRFGGGVGAAFGRVENNTSSFGLSSSIRPSDKRTDRWRGAAWELGVSLIFTKEDSEFEIGLRRSHFPRKGAEPQMPEITWNPTSFFVTVKF